MHNYLHLCNKILDLLDDSMELALKSLRQASRIHGNIYHFPQSNNQFSRNMMLLANKIFLSQIEAKTSKKKKWQVGNLSYHRLEKEDEEQKKYY